MTLYRITVTAPVDTGDHLAMNYGLTVWNAEPKFSLLVQIFRDKIFS